MKKKQTSLAAPTPLMSIQDAVKVARNIAILNARKEDPEAKIQGEAMISILEHVHRLEMTIEKFRIGLNQSQMAERDCPSFGLVGVYRRPV